MIGRVLNRYRNDSTPGAIRSGALALAALSAVTLVYTRWLGITNATTVALTFLLLVLIVASTSPLAVAVSTSIAAMLALNYFFLPPVGTLTIADPHNWVALVVFLAVSLVASRLSHVARARTAEAVGGRDELARLFDLSRDVLMMTATPDAISHLARSIARRFDLESVALALPAPSGAWTIATAGAATLALDERELTEAFRSATASLEFDAYARTYAGHRALTIDGRVVRLVPLRAGTTPIGLLAACGRLVEPGTLDALAGVVAIGVERMRLLEERKAAELTRQSEELKAALLASLGHDLRTPLTAIRIAAENLKAPWLAPEDRDEQSDLILTEVERLARLFDNVLEMARIDAGAIERATRWTHPSEIVAAAREQVMHAVKGHPVAVAIERDLAVQVDPRIVASALAHLLENAAQYAPDGTPIEVSAVVAEDGLTIRVRDHGPGIAAADLPHLFERFYRGTAAARHRASGTGLGLWIARGLLAAERGHVWAEDAPGGGALFSLRVPTAATEPHLAGVPS